MKAQGKDSRVKRRERIMAERVAIKQANEVKEMKSDCFASLTRTCLRIFARS